jgi:hypothetical protein
MGLNLHAISPTSGTSSRKLVRRERQMAKKSLKERLDLVKKERMARRGKKETRVSGMKTKAAMEKRLKAKYPNFFKDFPSLRAAFFEHPKFLEVFPDVEAAESASQKSEEYDALEQTLVGKSDPSYLLKTLKQNNPASLAKMAENFPTALREIDSNAYISMSIPIINELLYYAHAHGEKMKDKNLSLAAKHLANYVHANGGEIPDITKQEAAKAPTEAEKELEKVQSERAMEKFGNAAERIMKAVEPEINATVTKKLENLTAFERRQVVKEVRTELDEALNNDKVFQSQLRNLWARAKSNGYDSGSLSRIKRAWLDRARVAVPGIRNRLLKEALDARSGKGDTQSQSGKKRTFPSQGSGSGTGRRAVGNDPSKIDWRKTSDMDIING